MPPILLLSYVSGTYGNYVSQQLTKLKSNKFRLKYINDNIECWTDTGEKFHHNSSPWLSQSFYIDDCPFQNPSSWNIEHARKTVQTDPDWPLLDPVKFNIVFTHWYQDQDLKQLQDILQCRVVKIIYQSFNCDRIADRFVKISQFINNYTKPVDLDVYLKWVQTQANSSTEFATIEYERIFEPEYLKRWAEEF